MFKNSFKNIKILKIFRFSYEFFNLLQENFYEISRFVQEL